MYLGGSQAKVESITSWCHTISRTRVLYSFAPSATKLVDAMFSTIILDNLKAMKATFILVAFVIIQPREDLIETNFEDRRY